MSSTPHPPAGIDESTMDVIMPPQNSKTLPPIIRIGYYGANMVGASLGASKSINLFIEGTQNQKMLYQQHSLYYRRCSMDLVL